MDKNIRFLILICNDIFLIFISTLLSLILRSEKLPIYDAWSKPFVISVIIYIFLFYLFRPDREYFKYFNFLSLKKYFYLFMTYTITFIALLFFFKFYSTPRSIGIIQPPILFILLIISRYLAKELIKSISSPKNQEYLIIFGDVSTFDHILKDQATFFTSQILVHHNSRRLNKRTFQGKKIYTIDQFEKLVPKISKALLIIDDNHINKQSVMLIKNLLDYNFRFLSSSHKENKLKYNPLEHQKFLFEDTDFQIEKDFYKNKSILISGAGGSVGSAITQELSQIKNIQLILIDINEFNLFKLNNSYKSQDNIKIHLTNVLDKKKLSDLFDKYTIDIVIHAAAYKHVNILQNQEYEAIENNYLSTKNIYELSLSHKINNFLFISTDKAVRPTSVMGVSKRISEIYLQSMTPLNPLIKTTIVRFGNVLDSSGSVLPIFLEQIQKKQPLTLTHKDVQRYFMSIYEAAKLVLEANSLNYSGIFHLDMGKPIRIYNLAKKLIKINGYYPTEKEIFEDQSYIHIKEIGLFKGEKLFEELLIDGNIKITKNKKIFDTTEQINTDNAKVLLQNVDQFLKTNDKNLFSKILEYEDIFYQSN